MPKVGAKILFAVWDFRGSACSNQMHNYTMLFEAGRGTGAEQIKAFFRSRRVERVVVLELL